MSFSTSSRECAFRTAGYDTVQRSVLRAILTVRRKTQVISMPVSICFEFRLIMKAELSKQSSAARGDGLGTCGDGLYMKMRIW